jgi:D-alanine-D-alanine ligase
MNARSTVRTFRTETFSAAEQLGSQIDELKAKLRLAIVFAGDKTSSASVIYQAQNSRSWKSYEAVATDIKEGLQEAGFKHVDLMPEDMHLGERLRRHGAHMAWLNTGGVQGYNAAAHAASALEMAGVPYVGHNPIAATTLDNKHAFKREAVCAGLPTAPFTTWDMSRGQFRPELNSRFLRAFGDYTGPFIVKPVSGRASLNVHFVESRTDLPQAVADVHGATNNLVLIEQYLPGREFCVAVSGPVLSRKGAIEIGAEPFAFGVLERIFSKDERIFTSMDVKPINGDRFKHVDPAEEPELCSGLLRLAREVFLEFGLETLVRLDVRCDEAGGLHILEANPKPDLKRPSPSSTSLIAAGLERSGLSYEDLLVSLLADRLNFLLRHRTASMAHVFDLLGERVTPPSPMDDAADAMVLMLNGAALKMRRA